ncbi:MAG: choice-of-anchor J domain-containing protein [Bacteroidales bacterium]
MKRATILATLSLLFLSLTNINAQRLPESWTGDTGIETYKETTIVHEGSAAVKVVVNTDMQSSCDFQMENKVAISGADFKLSFWVKASKNVRITGIIDWTGAKSTQKNVYAGPASADWEEFTITGAVPSGATEAAVRIRFYDVPKSEFVPGEISYVDDVKFECPAGTAISIPNAGFETWPALLGTPTSYPTEFKAASGSNSVSVSWKDATDGVVPERYLIVGGEKNTPVIPADGKGYKNNLDLTAGTVYANVKAGVEGANFINATNGKEYFFYIFPYTNAGENAKYKIDGTFPLTSAVVKEFTNFYTEDFENGLNGWTPVSIKGDQAWIVKEDDKNKKKYAYMNGFSGKKYENEDWLISPVFDLSKYTNVSLSFDNAQGFKGLPLKVMVSTDYKSGDPKAATWKELNANWAPAEPYWSWTNSGAISLDKYVTKNTHIAFVYNSTDKSTATWEIDNITLSTGDTPTAIIETEKVNFDVYPNPCQDAINIVVEDNMDLQIINMQGAVVKSSTLAPNKNRVELNELPSGVYMVRISKEAQIKGVKRIILK